MRPGLDRIGRDVDRHVAEQAYAPAVRVRPQCAPLLVERELRDGARPGSRPRAPRARGAARRRRARAGGAGHCGQGAPPCCARSTVEQRVIVEPVGARREERVEARAVRRRQPRRVDERIVARAIGADPVRRPVRTGRPHRQDLPDQKPAEASQSTNRMRAVRRARRDRAPSKACSSTPARRRSSAGSRPRRVSRHARAASCHRVPRCRRRPTADASATRAGSSFSSR